MGHRYVSDYLTEEVLAHQPRQVRQFLLDTAPLERFSATLCDAVTASRRGREYLEELERRNPFLLPLDTQREWFRYHALFTDLPRTGPA